MQTSPSDGTAQIERALLGSILLDNSLWPQTAKLSAGDFSLDAHRKLFGKMAAMLEDQAPIDLSTLANELGKIGQLESVGGPAYISGLLDDALPVNFAAYVRAVREASVKRRVQHQVELLGVTSDLSSLRDQAQRLQELLSDSGETNWRQLFHSHQEVLSAPPTRFAIDGFLQEDGITLIGGLPGHGKTLCMLAMVRALLDGEGERLFCHFHVNRSSERVIYLIPEAGLTPFANRLKTFRLMEHISSGRLFPRTLSMPGDLALDDPRLLHAVKGADVFLDTCIRFLDGDENSAADQKKFAETLFALQRAGARTIVGAHHSPKAFGNASSMTLENVLRGSGDVGAMVVTAWGLSQVEAESNQIYVQNVKPRDFQPCEPFVIQGRPSLDQTGYFELIQPPGFAEEFSRYRDRKAGRPADPDKDALLPKAKEMRAAGKSLREISKVLEVSKSTVERWLTPTQ